MIPAQRLARWIDRNAVIVDRVLYGTIVATFVAVGVQFLRVVTE